METYRIPESYLEKRRFECPVCGQKWLIYVYERTSSYLVCCNVHYDWDLEVFSDPQYKGLKFEAIEDEQDNEDYI